MDVAYQINGSGPRTVVLANALGSTTRVWQRQWAALEAEFRVVRYDHRGHGGTPPGDPVHTIADHATDVLELLDRIGADRVSIAGTSMGGNVAMWLAANVPERIDRVVLACTSAQFGDPRNWIERAAAVRAEGTGAIADTIMQRWFTEPVRREHPALVEQFRADFSAVDDGAYAASCEALSRWDFRDDLVRIGAPALVIGGRDDPAAGPDAVALVADRIPAAKLEILDAAAHMANVEQPERFTQLVMDHLA